MGSAAPPDARPNDQTPGGTFRDGLQQRRRSTGALSSGERAWSPACPPDAHPTAQSFDGIHRVGLPQRRQSVGALSLGDRAWALALPRQTPSRPDTSRVGPLQRRRSTVALSLGEWGWALACPRRTSRRPEIRRGPSRQPAASATKYGRTFWGLKGMGPGASSMAHPTAQRSDGTPRDGLLQRRRSTDALSSGYGPGAPDCPPTHIPPPRNSAGPLAMAGRSGDKVRTHFLRVTARGPRRVLTAHPAARRFDGAPSGWPPGGLAGYGRTFCLLQGGGPGSLPDSRPTARRFDGGPRVGRLQRR